MHRAAILAFLAGSACGLVIVAYAGWPILAAGVASVLAGYFYTAGADQLRPARPGRGQASSSSWAPVMVMASYYVQLEELSWPAFYASLPVGILVANILHANNLRDIENDRSRGKVTLSTLAGRPGADYGLWALVVGGVRRLSWSAVALDELSAWSLLVLGSLPAAAMTLRVLKETEARALNPLVRGSARLHMQFGVLLALGLSARAVT